MATTTVPTIALPAPDAGFDRVLSWRIAHPGLWEILAASARDIGATMFDIVATAYARTMHAAAVIVDGAILAAVCADDRVPLSWLEATAEFIAVSISRDDELVRMTDELLETYDQLSFLYDTTRMLTSNMTLPQSLRLILAQARIIVGAQGGALVVVPAVGASFVLADGEVPPEQFLLQIHERAIVQGRPLVSNTAASFRAYAGEDADGTTIASVVIAPVDTPECRVTAMCFGAIKTGEFTAGNRKLVQALAERSSAIAARYAHEDEQIRQSRIAHDLELAARIQATLLPAPFPGTTQVSLSAIMLPANEVGGDFYLHPDRALPDDAPFAVCIGDVAGKGVAAALISTMCLSALRAEARRNATPADALRAVCGFVVEELERIESFVSCVYAQYDPRHRVLTYANAGHMPILHWQAATGAIELLGATGMPFGVESELKIGEAHCSLAVGDVLLLYTDGITEAADAQHRLFGDLRLYASLAAAAQLPCAAVQHAVLSAVQRFTPVQRDDLTLLVLKVEQ